MQKLHKRLGIKLWTTGVHIPISVTTESVVIDGVSEQSSCAVYQLEVPKFMSLIINYDQFCEWGQSLALSIYWISYGRSAWAAEASNSNCMYETSVVRFQSQVVFRNYMDVREVTHTLAL